MAELYFSKNGSLVTSSEYFNNEVNKVSSKEELTNLLNLNKNVLSNSMLLYLNALIDLDYSAIKSNITNDERKSLSKLDVYRRITVYNIYYRALNIFNLDKETLKISGNTGLSVYAPLKHKEIELFDFSYNYNKKTKDNIIIYQTIENEKQRQAELQEIIKQLEILYDEKCPYNFQDEFYGGPWSQWNYLHKEKINRYEQKFIQLDRTILTDDEKREIEITKKYHDLFINDYGLEGQSFKTENNKAEDLMHKKLVRKMPGVNITNDINYL